MKKCSSCKEPKNVDQFTKNESKADGLNHCCKQCQRHFAKDHYAKNKQAYVSRAAARKAENLALVRSAKDRPCLRCGGSFHFSVMDLDHRPGERKLFALSSPKALGGSRQVLLDEIQKCDVLCANCHRYVTWCRANNLLADGSPP